MPVAANHGTDMISKIVPIGFPMAWNTPEPEYHLVEALTVPPKFLHRKWRAGFMRRSDADCGLADPLHALQRRRPAARRAALQRRRDPTTAPTRCKLRQQNGSVLTVFVGPVREN